MKIKLFILGLSLGISILSGCIPEPEIFRTVELAHKIRLQVSVQRIVYFP